MHACNAKHVFIERPLYEITHQWTNVWNSSHEPECRGDDNQNTPSDLGVTPHTESNERGNTQHRSKSVIEKPIPWPVEDRLASTRSQPFDEGIYLLGKRLQLKSVPTAWGQKNVARRNVEQGGGIYVSQRLIALTSSNSIVAASLVFLYTSLAVPDYFHPSRV